MGQWRTVLYSCSVFDEARLDAASPGWAPVVAGVLRRCLLARCELMLLLRVRLSHMLLTVACSDDSVTLQLGRLCVTFDVACSEGASSGKRGHALGCATASSAVALQRTRALQVAVVRTGHRTVRLIVVFCLLTRTATVWLCRGRDGVA